MAKDSTARKEEELQVVYDTAEQQWASRVINTLLTEAQNRGAFNPGRLHHARNLHDKDKIRQRMDHRVPCSGDT